MGQSKDQKAAIEGRRRQVTNLYLRHVPQARIAKALNVARNTVASDLRWLQEQCRKERLGDPVAVKARELARLDQMEYEAAEAFLGYNVLVDGEPVRISGDGRWWGRRLALKKRRARCWGWG